VHAALDFNSTGDFCSWDLVHCIPGGYSITVSGNAAAGKRFDLVFGHGNFSEMGSLLANFAGFEGTLPASLSAAVGLQVFSLQGNQLRPSSM
jgi:hypothetical protein